MGRATITLVNDEEKYIEVEKRGTVYRLSFEDLAEYAATGERYDPRLEFEFSEEEKALRDAHTTLNALGEVEGVIPEKNREIIKAYVNTLTLNHMEKDIGINNYTALNDGLHYTLYNWILAIGTGTKDDKHIIDSEEIMENADNVTRYLLLRMFGIEHEPSDILELRDASVYPVVHHELNNLMRYTIPSEIRKYGIWMMSSDY
jgi:hypothetical protein